MALPSTARLRGQVLHGGWGTRRRRHVWRTQRNVGEPTIPSLGLRLIPLSFDPVTNTVDLEPDCKTLVLNSCIQVETDGSGSSSAFVLRLTTTQIVGAQTDHTAHRYGCSDT